MPIPRSRWISVIIFAVGELLAGRLLATQLELPKSISTSSNAPQSRQTKQPPTPAFDPNQISRTFSQIAARVVPTVVSIATTKMIPLLDADRAAGSFNRGHDLENRSFRFYQPRLYRQQSAGSGIILTPDGHILTNVHVIKHATKITVTLHDDRVFFGKVVGADPLTEVAVLKIETRGLPTASLGNSDQLDIGQWVLAVGNPLNLRSTVTAGIISAKGRDINIIHGDYGVENFIQTDAAINPGNSGGALVNLAGQVIGVNTAIATETGYAMGLGFAIPINLARKVAVDLMREGKVSRGYLGMALQEITEVHARALKLAAPAGVLVDEVYHESPAQTGGLLPMDVILALDDLPVQRVNQLQAMIAGKSPGTIITLRLIRREKELEKKIKLGELPAEQSTAANSTGANQLQRARFKNLGLAVEPLTELDAAALSYTGKGGVLTVRVEKFSPADESGLRVDDIIVVVDREVVRRKEEFFAYLQKLKSGEIAILTVIRRGGQYHIFIEAP